MNAKTMEGLAGASTSISMISTPMNIAKEAERKGDTEKMKRAMSYGAEMAGQAEAYSEKTSQGMKLEAEEAKKQEKQQQEDLIRARREERKEWEEKLQEGSAEHADVDRVEISGDGTVQTEAAGQAAPKEPAADSQDIVYDQTGGTVEPSREAGANINVSV